MKKIVFWPAIGVVVFGAATFFLSGVFKNNLKNYQELPENNYINYIEAGEYDKAMSGYDESKISQNKKNKYKEYAVARLDTAYTDYVAQTVSYEEVSGLIECLESTALAQTEKGDKTVDKIEKLKVSRDSYESGIEKMRSGNYAGGLEDLYKVIPEDSNYDDAVGKMEFLLREYRFNILEEAKLRKFTGDFDGARSLCDVVLALTPNDEEFAAEKDDTDIIEHSVKMQEIIDTIVAEKFNGEDVSTYQDVIDALNAAIKENDNDQILIDKRDEFEEQRKMVQ